MQMSSDEVGTFNNIEFTTYNINKFKFNKLMIQIDESLILDQTLCYINSIKYEQEINKNQITIFIND